MTKKELSKLSGTATVRATRNGAKKAVTVYITQEMRGRDLSDALRFGDVVTILPAKEQVSLSPAPTLNRIKRKLAKFGDEDYLILSGDPVCIALAANVAADNNRGRYKVLKWDRLDQKYYPIQVDLYRKGE